MGDAIERGETVPNPPERDVLGWIQREVFTSPQAYYDEGRNERIIDAMWGGEGVWLWAGLANEGGHKYTFETDDGVETEVVEMARVCIEQRDRACIVYDMRYIRVVLVGGEVKVCIFHFAVNYGDDTEFSEARFLEPDEVAAVYDELLGIS